jgi:nitrogen fixation protein NifU and related proteins
MLNLYQEILMDHYKNPRNKGFIEHGCFVAEQRNSSCGDEIVCSGSIVDNALLDVRFDGKGCVISQATASLLSEKAKTCTIEEIAIFDKDYLCSLIGMPLGPVRMQCALLSLHALQNGINQYRQKSE